MLKEELVTELNTTLRQNETKYGSDPAFTEFYARTGSPIKKEKGAPTDKSDAEKQPRKRRQTLKVKEELDSLYDSSVYFAHSFATLTRYF